MTTKIKLGMVAALGLAVLASPALADPVYSLPGGGIVSQEYVDNALNYRVHQGTVNWGDGTDEYTLDIRNPSDMGANPGIPSSVVVAQTIRRAVDIMTHPENGFVRQEDFQNAMIYHGMRPVGDCPAVAGQGCLIVYDTDGYAYWEVITRTYVDPFSPINP